MPKLNGKGPDGNGSKTGRSLGTCSDEVNNSQLGIGIGKRRNSGGETGNRKRLKYDKHS
jgi:hypothetical protein